MAVLALLGLTIVGLPVHRKVTGLVVFVVVAARLMGAPWQTVSTGGFTCTRVRGFSVIILVVVSGPQVPSIISRTVNEVPGPTNVCTTFCPLAVLFAPEFGSPKL